MKYVPPILVDQGQIVVRTQGIAVTTLEVTGRMAFETLGENRTSRDTLISDPT